MKNTKKILSLLMSLVMLLSITTSIDLSAYAYTSGGFEYSVSGSNATITKYTGSATSVTIPSKIGSYTVTSIGECAFYYCTSLTSVTIPDSVKWIDDRAFSNCTSLTSVTIPDSVTSIGECAFYYCTSLTSVTIPDSVTSIGDYAFYSCKSLTSVTIGNSVTSIGSWAFEDCTSLTSVTIGNSVTSIGSSAFERCTSLTSVTIPNSVTSIGGYAFSGCTSLTSVTIPNSVTSIGSYAFDECTSLTSVTIGNSVTSIGEYAFYNCTSLTSVTIPNSVTSIGDGTFEDCTSLTSVTIGDSVTSIGNWAFSECTSLTNITVSSGNPNYLSDDGVLFNKDKTELIQYPVGNTRTDYNIPFSVTSIGNSAFGKCTSLTSVTIPNSVKRIGNSAFDKCTNITSVTIGNSVTSIDEYAFYYCTSLTSITIPNSVTSIGECAFGFCTNLLNITVPDNVINIGMAPFAACISLNSIDISSNNLYYSSQDGILFNKDKTTLIQFPAGKIISSYMIPDSVSSIGVGAFGFCTSLTSVTIPDSVTSIDDEVFAGCSNLKSLIIPKNVTSIGYFAFSYCTSLTSVTIPDSVTSIGNYAFSECTSLTNVYYTGSKTQWNSISIGEENDNLLNSTIHYESVSNGFTLGRDNNSYIHYNDENSGFYGVTNYYINDDYIRSKLINLSLSNGELSTILDAMNKSWNGSCYGIAETIGMNYLGYTTIDNISSFSADNYYSLKRPCENPLLLDTIEYYHLTQYLKNYGRSSSNCIMTLYGWSGWWDNAPQKLSTYTNSDFYQLLIQAVAENYTVLLGYGEENGSGHAIITCGVEQISNNVYRIKLYDENDITDFGYLTITNNNGKYSAVSTYNYIYQQDNKWIDSGDDLLKHLNYMFYLPLDTLTEIVPYTSTNSYSFDTPDLSSPISRNLSNYEDDSMVLILDLNNDFSLELENGKYLNYSDGEFNGTVDIYNIQFIVNGNSSQISLETEKADTVEYSSTDDTHITVYDDDNYLSLSGNQIESANINLDNGIILSGDEYDFTATVNRVYTDNNVDIVKISGSANDNVTVKTDGNNVSVSSEKIISDISVESISQDSSETIMKNTDLNEFVADEDNNITTDTEHQHSYKTTLKAPTCIENGVRTYTCSICNDSYTETITATGHSYSNDVISPTCSAKGYTKHTCSVCGDTYNDNYVNATAHSNRVTVSKATVSKNGSVVSKCSKCGKSTTQVIYYPKTITLSATSYAYDGKVKIPSVTVKDSKGKTLKKNTDYTVSYSKGRKYVGKYAVKITFKGNYSGTKTVYFSIKPKGTSLSKVAAGKKGFKAYWKKQSTQTTGYQIQYSTNKNFKKAKTVTVGKNSTTSKSISKLSGKKKYYVRVRTYKKVGSTYYYSSWSKAKPVITKK